MTMIANIRTATVSTETSNAPVSGLRKTFAAVIAALALGSAFAAVGTAEARPMGGGHHGGGHGGGWHHRPHHGPFHHRPHRHHGHWGGGYGLIGGAVYVASGPRCRLVERINPYGEVVVRRVCPRPIYY